MFAELHSIWDNGILAMTDEEYAAKQRRSLLRAEGLEATKSFKAALSTFCTEAAVMVRVAAAIAAACSLVRGCGRQHTRTHPAPSLALPPMAPKVKKSKKKKVDR